jgi:proline dehydrogenase
MNVTVEIDMEDSDLTSDTLRLFRDAATGHPQTRLASSRLRPSPRG